MKRMIIVFLLLCGVCCAAKPVIVRDELNTRAYHVFVPADKDGVNWTQWTLSPSAATDFPDSLPIQAVFYGKVRPVKRQAAADADTNTGWTEYTGFDGNWRVQIETTAGPYLEWTIPADHENISILLYFATGFLSTGSVDLTLDGSTADLDVTNVTPTTTTGVTEYKVASNASDGTTRTFRMAAASDVDGSNRVYAVGIKSWSTASTVSPADAGGAGIITTFAADGNVDNYDPSIVSGLSDLAIFDNTLEFTMNWNPDGVLPGKWTAYGAHYSAADAPFTVTVNPELFVDGVSLGDMTDELDIAFGEINEADTITCIVEGKGVYLTTTHEQLLLRITQDFTQAGLATSSRATWAGAAETGGGAIYVPSVLIPGDYTGNIQLPQSDTLTVIGSDYSGLKGNTVIASIDNQPYEIIATSIGPTSEIKEQGGTNKIYFEVSDAVLPGTTFNVDHYEIASGSVWAMGGTIRIAKIGTAGGSGTGAGGGYRSRYGGGGR